MFHTLRSRSTLSDGRCSCMSKISMFLPDIVLHHCSHSFCKPVPNQSKQANPGARDVFAYQRVVKYDLVRSPSKFSQVKRRPF